MPPSIGLTWRSSTPGPWRMCWRMRRYSCRCSSGITIRRNRYWKPCSASAVWWPPTSATRTCSCDSRGACGCAPMRTHARTSTPRSGCYPCRAPTGSGPARRHGRSSCVITPASDTWNISTRSGARPTRLHPERGWSATVGPVPNARSNAVASGNGIMSLRDSTVLLCGLILVLVGLLSVAFMRPDMDVDFVWFAILTALLAVPLVIGCMTRRLDVLDPTSIVAVAYFLYFVYAPIRNLMAHDSYFFGKLIMPLLPLGLLYLAFGIVGLWAGYYSSRLARRVASRIPGPPESHAGAVPYAWIVALMAIVAFSAYMRVAGLSWERLLSLGQLGGVPTAIQGGAGIDQGAFSNYLYSTLDWLTSALMLLIAFARRGRKWLVVMFLALLVVYSTIGFRFRVVVLVLAPVVFYYLRAQRRPS